jgi:4-diphosphocytidyl-2C-methyl-D-erythritol kinase
MGKMISHLLNQVNAASQKKPACERSSQRSYQANGKTKRQRPKSRRSRQRHQQKQAKEQKQQEQYKTNEFQKESLATYLRIEKEIKYTYGFVADPSLTSGHNLAI